MVTATALDAKETAPLGVVVAVATRHHNRSTYKAAASDTQAEHCQSKRANCNASSYAPNSKRKHPKRGRHTDHYQQS